MVQWASLLICSSLVHLEIDLLSLCLYSMYLHGFPNGFSSFLPPPNVHVVELSVNECVNFRMHSMDWLSHLA